MAPFSIGGRSAHAVGISRRPPAVTAPTLVAQRNCDGCTLCCNVMGVPTLDKPGATWCAHCAVGRGCGIYETRPPECRSFYCHYRQLADLPEHWQPLRSHMVMTSQSEGKRVIVLVDPARPEAWKREPYHGDLRRWSAHALAADQQFHVIAGGRLHVVLPDRDVDLGPVGDNLVSVDRVLTKDGMRYEVLLAARTALDDAGGAVAPNAAAVSRY